jgi:hypothetical protein
VRGRLPCSEPGQEIGSHTEQAPSRPIAANAPLAGSGTGVRLRQVSLSNDRLRVLAGLWDLKGVLVP